MLPRQDEALAFEVSALSCLPIVEQQSLQNTHISLYISARIWIRLPLKEDGGNEIVLVVGGVDLPAQ